MVWHTFSSQPSPWFPALTFVTEWIISGAVSWHNSGKSAQYCCGFNLVWYYIMSYQNNCDDICLKVQKFWNTVHLENLIHFTWLRILFFWNMVLHQWVTIPTFQGMKAHWRWGPYIAIKDGTWIPFVTASYPRKTESSGAPLLKSQNRNM